jgi:tetratricopeptide (TPR) repeat protein
LILAGAIALFGLLSQGAAQQQKVPKRKDSVDASAGVSKEQLALEDRLHTVLTEADQKKRTGNIDGAIVLYESAAEMVNREPLLTEQKERVLDALANAYVIGNRAKDALPIYSKALERSKPFCVSDSREPSKCAEAERNLALAKMHIEDFSSAVPLLQDARSQYARREQIEDMHEFKMLAVKEQAETSLVLSVALYRLGKTEEAIAAAEGAIPQFTRVQADQQILIGIRDSAANSLQRASDLLAKYKAPK